MKPKLIRLLAFVFLFFASYFLSKAQGATFWFNADYIPWNEILLVYTDSKSPLACLTLNDNAYIGSTVTGSPLSYQLPAYFEPNDMLEIACQRYTGDEFYDWRAWITVGNPSPSIPEPSTDDIVISPDTASPNTWINLYNNSPNYDYACLVTNDDAFWEEIGTVYASNSLSYMIPDIFKQDSSIRFLCYTGNYEFFDYFWVDVFDCPNGQSPDNIGDACNPDEDNDNWLDSDDACPNDYGTQNGCPVRESLCPDGQGFDSFGDACNRNEDGDAWVDWEDACPYVYGTNAGCPPEEEDAIRISNASCPDGTSFDSIGDVCDHDEDDDTWLDDEDLCPYDYGSREGCPQAPVNPKEGDTFDLREFLANLPINWQWFGFCLTSFIVLPFIWNFFNRNPIPLPINPPKKAYGGSRDRLQDIYQSPRVYSNFPTQQEKLHYRRQARRRIDKNQACLRGQFQCKIEDPQLNLQLYQIEKLKLTVFKRSNHSKQEIFEFSNELVDALNEIRLNYMISQNLVTLREALYELTGEIHAQTDDWLKHIPFVASFEITAELQGSGIEANLQLYHCVGAGQFSKWEKFGNPWKSEISDNREEAVILLMVSELRSQRPNRIITDIVNHFVEFVENF